MSDLFVMFEQRFSVVDVEDWIDCETDWSDWRKTSKFMLKKDRAITAVVQLMQKIPTLAKPNTAIKWLHGKACVSSFEHVGGSIVVDEPLRFAAWWFNQRNKGKCFMKVSFPDRKCAKVAFTVPSESKNE